MKILSIIATAAAAMAITACSEHGNDPHDHDHDHDIVSRVEYTLIGINTPDTLTFVWEDADGPGGNNPNRIDTMVLDSGVAYRGALRLSNTTVTPAKDLTSNVRDDMGEHQFFFTVSDSLVNVSIQDLDERGLPVGLATTVIAPRRGTGSLTIELSHFDDSSRKNGTDRSDETDVSITFPVVVR